MQNIIKNGQLVPNELIVEILITALIANPSKNYLIDGFPREVNQAIMFEQQVGECQQVLYFNTPLDVCIQRCLVRAQTSGRVDDTPEIIEKRLQTYINESAPVIEMYKRFGKVSEVDGSGDQIEVFRETRKAMLPQVSWMIGPKVSGKSELGRRLAERTNAKHFSFLDWRSEKGFREGDSDEKVVHALIHQLSLEIAPKVVIEDFPQNAYQAKFFITNAVSPSIVFQLNCSYDTSQERMLSL
jgi:UMP-CMP kinase